MTETVTKTIRKGYQNHCQRVLKRSEKGIKTITKACAIGKGYQNHYQSVCDRKWVSKQLIFKYLKL